MANSSICESTLLDDFVNFNFKVTTLLKFIQFMYLKLFYQIVIVDLWGWSRKLPLLLCTRSFESCVFLYHKKYVLYFFLVWELLRHFYITKRCFLTPQKSISLVLFVVWELLHHFYITKGIGSMSFQLHWAKNCTVVCLLVKTSNKSTAVQNCNKCEVYGIIRFL